MSMHGVKISEDDRDRHNGKPHLAVLSKPCGRVNPHLAKSALYASRLLRVHLLLFSLSSLLLALWQA